MKLALRDRGHLRQVEDLQAGLAIADDHADAIEVGDEGLEDDTVNGEPGAWRSFLRRTVSAGDFAVGRRGGGWSVGCGAQTIGVAIVIVTHPPGAWQDVRSSMGSLSPDEWELSQAGASTCSRVRDSTSDVPRMKLAPSATRPA